MTFATVECFPLLGNIFFFLLSSSSVGKLCLGALALSCAGHWSLCVSRKLWQKCLQKHVLWELSAGSHPCAGDCPVLCHYMWLLWTIPEFSTADVNVVWEAYKAPSQAAAWPSSVLPSQVTSPCSLWVSSLLSRAITFISVLSLICCASGLGNCLDKSVLKLIFFARLTFWDSILRLIHFATMWLVSWRLIIINKGTFKTNLP